MGLFGGGDAADIAAAAREQSDRQFQQAQEEMKKVAEYLETQGIPSTEAQRIALEYAQVGPSALEDVQIDPRLKDAQMGALSKLQEMGGAGLTQEEKAQQMMMQRSVAGDAQARDKAILQNMAERGMGGSGSELIARLQGSQSAADRNAVSQAQLAGQAQNRALQSIAQAGQLGGQIRQQDYGQAAEAASAADRIAQFNAQNRAGAQQQQEMHNKGLIQQQFQNEMAKKQAVAAARTGTAQAGMQQAARTMQAGQAAAQGAAQERSGALGALGTLAGAGVGAYFGGATGAQLGAKLGGTAGSFADGGAVQPMSPAPAMDITAPNSNGGFAGGGVPVPEMDDERVIPGDDFNGDRVDAKINSGEMVINVEQQQRLMDLLRGLRDLQGLGNEDIAVPMGGENPSPDMVAPHSPEGNDNFADGGMVPAEYKTPTEAKPRGIHAGLKHEKQQEEKHNNDSKARKARIKAYETLINGGR